MTPLEELQAAHKRLSELRYSTEEGPWTTSHCEFEDHTALFSPWSACFVHTEDKHDADLIVTLHRTIEAQLAMLAAAIEVHQVIDWADFADIPHHMALARAINGEAS